MQNYVDYHFPSHQSSGLRNCKREKGRKMKVDTELSVDFFSDAVTYQSSCVFFFPFFFFSAKTYKY